MIEHPDQETAIAVLDDRVDPGLHRLRRAESGELGEEVRLGHDVDIVAVPVLELAQLEIQLPVSTLFHGSPLSRRIGLPGGQVIRSERPAKELGEARGRHHFLPHEMHTRPLEAREREKGRVQ